ncbi:hypothetical protein [Falsirhodobacter sp. 1013]|uniref:hypothetical protein n=1 Tax=Falsirhodobacter sp. 1013 TaxID=3417566 RepID=UPI003EBB1CD6
MFQVLRPTHDRVPELTNPSVTHFSIYCEDVRAVGEAMARASGRMLKGPVPCSAQEEGEENVL